MVEFEGGSNKETKPQKKPRKKGKRNKTQIKKKDVR
jgi:hypothetical protein